MSRDGRYVRPPRCHRRDCWHPASRHAGGDGKCVACDCTGWLDSEPHRWRETNWLQWFLHDQSWLEGWEADTKGYREETIEYKEIHPRPTFKATLLSNAGMNTDPALTDYRTPLENEHETRRTD